MAVSVKHSFRKQARNQNKKETAFVKAINPVYFLNSRFHQPPEHPRQSNQNSFTLYFLHKFSFSSEDREIGFPLCAYGKLNKRNLRERNVFWRAFGRNNLGTCYQGMVCFKIFLDRLDSHCYLKLHDHSVTTSVFLCK